MLDSNERDAWRVDLLIRVNRLNTKIEPREVAVVDLVKDLSDGVSYLTH